MLLIETGFVLLSLLIALVRPELGFYWFEKLERHFHRLSQRRGLAVALVGLMALTVRAALLPIEPIPQPTIPDEFSYLLMSDTFAHGRLTNPTHPMSLHFDAPGVNQQPTYVSKYFPGPGLVLAFGQKLLGHPFWGVWLSVGFMCASICWMLQGWFSPFWALVGSILAVIRLGTFSYWANSYFGGTLAAIGGALVLGAVPRIKRGHRVTDSLMLGVGLALLASSRPFEGLIFSLPVVAVLLAWFFRKLRSDGRSAAVRAVVPAALVLALAFAAMLYYFWRATGSPFRTPYQVNLQFQDPVPLFPWQPLRSGSPTDMLQPLVGGEIEQYHLVRSHFVLSSITRGIQFYLFYLGPALTIPFFVATFGETRRKRGLRFLIFVLSVSFVGLLLPIYFGPSYGAALSCVIYALLVAGIRGLRKLRWHRASGLALARAVPVICFSLFLLRAFAPLPGVPVPRMVPLTWCSPHLFENLSRRPVQNALESKPGLHLALLRHPEDGLEPVDWVQNLADIDQQKVVWASDLGAESNQNLLRYFKDRQVWLVEPDRIPPRVSPYTDHLEGPQRPRPETTTR
jgi:hypothetical protein